MNQETSAHDKAVYQDLRERLVDRSRRNRLLNFRHTPSAPLIRIVDAVPGHVVAQLQDDARLRFRSLPDPNVEPQDEQTPEFQAGLQHASLDEAYQAAIRRIDPDDPSGLAVLARLERDLRDRVRASLKLPRRQRTRDIDPAKHARSLGITPDYDLPSPNETPVPRRADNSLQTLLFPDQLKNRITKIYRNTRSIEQETGVNTLHLAIGFLEWFEADLSGEALLSPLLVLPVALERRTVRGREEEYRLAALDSTPNTNLSLELRLRDDFALRFPEFDADATHAVEDYFAAIQDMIRVHPRWRVRRFLTLASFSFARIAMYHDLEPANWITTGSAEAHQLVRPILRGTSADPDAGIGTFAPEYDIDSPVIESIAPILVQDADSSQHSAIIDAVKGRSFVIEGPPGTGKSQTIANLIATFLHQGKTVLFVSEKMAALEVVKSRLDKVHLGDFCLTLHSAGARPATVIEALKRRVERHPPRPPPPSQGATHIAMAKSEMASYLAALHAEIGPHAETAHDLIGRYTEIERKFPNFPSVFRRSPAALPSPITREMAAIARQRLEALEDAAGPIDTSGRRPTDSPFRVLARNNLFPDEQQELLGALETILKYAPAVTSCGARLAGLVGETVPSTVKAAKELLDRIEGLAEAGETVDLTVAARLTSPSAAETALTLSNVASETNRFAARLADAGLSDPAAALPEKLTALGRLVEVLGVERLTIGDLPNVAAEFATLAKFIEQHDQVVAHLTELLGFERASISMLDAMCTAAELAAEVDPAWQQHCRAGLHRHALLLTEAADRQEKWQSRIREMNATLATQDLTPAAAKNLALTLKNAGFLGGLRREVRSARKQFADIWRGGVMPNVTVRVEHLEMAAVLLEERDALSENPATRAVLPEAFDPFSVHIRPFALAASWQFRVEDVLTSDTYEVVRIRAALLSLGQHRHAQLAALAGPAANLRRIPDSAQITANTAWDEAKRIVGARSAGVADLILAVKVLGLNDRVPLASLTDLADLTRRWQEGAKKLASPCSNTLFGGVMPSIPALRDTARFAFTVHRALPKAAGRLLAGGWNEQLIAPREAGAELRATLAIINETLDRLTQLGLNQFASDATNQPVGSMVRVATELLAAKSDLPHYLRFATAREDCIANPLSKSVTYAHEANGTILTSLPTALDWLVAWTLVRRAAGADRQVFSRAGVQLDALRRNFAHADRASLSTAATEVAIAAHRRRVPSGSSYGSRKGWTDGALLQNEFGKQRRHIPLRDLLGRAGGAVTALTPCIMMSPLTVAQYLRPGKFIFDLVVMDEASQIKPEDAVGALLRGRQTVIVGDPKQLPPTNFFDRALDDDAEDDDGDDSVLQAGDKIVAESVLDLAARSFQPARRLRWHYRSQHESLIAFSNREFYEDDLIVFPASRSPAATLGIEFVQVDGIWRNRTNPEEAQALAAAAISFMRNYPNLSYGIVAMNQPQRELLQAEIDVRSANDADVETYREKWESKLEPPFVKNLENVQGDERDVIFISLGWGKTPEGAIHQRFFPVNRKEDGHRRLNVLLTRARKKLVLFSSLRPEDIAYDPEKTARGVRVLRNYLIYARDGRLDPGIATGHGPDSPFEIAVAEALRERGHVVELQVGVAGYFIDIAIRHPTKPASFVLGIECDGATYHRAKSARDRDRLRQEALERLGWRLLRVWSTDWFRDHVAEADRLSATIIAMIDSDRETDTTASRLVDQPASSPDDNATHEAPEVLNLFQPELTDVDGHGRTKRSSPESSTTPLFAYQDLPTTLRRFRDEVILTEYPGSEPERCILRDEMITAIVQEHLNDPEEFTTKIPQWMRTRTDGRQMKYLGQICDLVDQHGASAR